MRKEVMLSSSLRGEQMKALREAAKAGIQEAQLAVSACEPWPALTIGALDASLKLVREADYYLLVVAGRYGSRVRHDDDRSFTEVEFDEATEATTARGLKRLAFFEEPMTMETTGSPDEQAEQYRKQLLFREKVRNSRITPITFRTPEDLRREVGRALLTSVLAEHERPVDRPEDEKQTVRGRFHAVHEYSLLDTSLAGRTEQIAALSKWAAGKKTIMVVELFGGFGKSALTWWWWELQKDVDTWSKGLWFTFYELSSTVHEFFSQLHAHLADEPIDTSRGRSNEWLASETLKLCRQNRHLIVLDGFERTLPIMDGIDANAERPDKGAPTENAVEPSISPQLRGLRSIHNKFLAKWLVLVANELAARLLITTRYRPSNLENVVGRPRRGVEHMELGGFSLAEAKEYWGLIGLDPNDPGLQRLVAGVHGHPLTLEVMAGTLGTSESRLLAHFFSRKPEFPVLKQKITPRDGRDDVFEDALASLDGKARILLETIALWPLPAPLKDLTALMCHSGPSDLFDKPFGDIAELVDAILGLEERRLISRNANSAADMHPVMRDVVRARTSLEARNATHGQIVDEFAKRRRRTKAKSIEDIAAEIQLTISAARINRWDVAIETYAFYVVPELDRLNHRRIKTELLTEFFTKTEGDDGVLSVTWKNQVPYVKSPPMDKENKEEYLQKQGVPLAQVLQFKARQDFAQGAGSSHVSLGHYALAAAFYREHNKTCSEPFCPTQQKECFEQQGKFGYAAKILEACLVDLDLNKVRPREKKRLAEELFEDCVERDMVRDARTALARQINLSKTSPWLALTKNSMTEQLRDLNNTIAKLAEREGMPDAAVAIARDTLKSAKSEGHHADEVSAMRTLARSLRADGRFEEAADAFDTVLSLDPDRDHYGGLWDKAHRARNLISLRQFDAAAEELEAVIERAHGVALSTHATALIYRAELQRALGDSATERESLRAALDIYSMYPSTPIDLWGVRTCLTRLRSLNAIDDTDVSRRQFREPLNWPRKLLAGTDRARVSARDESFALTAIWSLHHLADREP